MRSVNTDLLDEYTTAALTGLLSRADMIVFSSCQHAEKYLETFVDTALKVATIALRKRQELIDLHNAP